MIIDIVNEARTTEPIEVMWTSGASEGVFYIPHEPVPSSFLARRSVLYEGACQARHRDVVHVRLRIEAALPEVRRELALDFGEPEWRYDFKGGVYSFEGQHDTFRSI